MKTARVTIYPVRGTSTTLAYVICYRGITLNSGTGHDRGTISSRAKLVAKNQGFTHVKIFHEYLDHPASGGTSMAI
jgi:hypothetical protein